VPTTDLARALIDRGLSVDVVTTAREVDDPTVLEGPHLRVMIAPLRDRARDRAKDLFARERAAIERLLRSSGAELVHAMWTYEFAWAAQSDGRPAVVTAHDAPLTVLRQMRDSYRAVRTAMAYMTRARIRHLTAVSPYLADRWRREMLYRGPITVIPNMVLNPPNSSGSRALERSLLDISDAGRSKNIPALIEAFALIRRERPQLILDLVGPGLGGTGEIAQWARTAGQADGVRFRGVLDRAGVAAALAGACVFVHPSREESFGLSIVEAMAAGVPVVAGGTSGAVPWVLGGTGLLVDVDKPKEIADAVRNLLDDSSLSADLAAQARQRALETFSPEIVADAYLETYDRVLSVSARRAA